MDELREWRSFLAVAGHGGFTRAADAIAISQPNLSRHITALERRLGLQLFDRAGKRVRLTDPGAHLLNPARELVAMLDKLLLQAARISGGESASLRLGATAQTLASFVAPMLPHLMRSYPSLDLRLSEGSVDQLLEGLHEGKLDYAVVSTSVQEPLNSVPLYRADIQLIVPVQAHRRYPSVVDVALLDGEPLMLPTTASGTRRLFDAACVQSHVQPVIQLESENAQVLAELVHEGYGAAILPSTAATDPKRVRRHALKAAGRRICATMSVAWNTELYHSRAAVLLFEEIRRFARERRAPAGRRHSGKA